jgi:hypothetical protein
MDEFTQAYIVCALWSTNDESDPSGGEPLKDNYDLSDIDSTTLANMVADCKRFQEENAWDIDKYSKSIYTKTQMAGHNFFLSRNGHGAGFFDGDWPEDARDRLQRISEGYGGYDLYVEDGKIRGYPC